MARQDFGGWQLFPVSFEELLVSHILPGFIACVDGWLASDLVTNGKASLVIGDIISRELLAFALGVIVMALILGTLVDCLRHLSLDVLLRRLGGTKSLSELARGCSEDALSEEKLRLCRFFRGTLYLWAELWGNMCITALALGGLLWCQFGWLSGLIALFFGIALGFGYTRFLSEYSQVLISLLPQTETGSARK